MTRRPTSHRKPVRPSGRQSVRAQASIRRATTPLREVLERLRVMQSSVAVAVAALRVQNADLDEDVARHLIRAVSDPLQDQIDTIKSVLRALGPPTRRKR
jgi:hypothetical protein